MSEDSEVLEGAKEMPFGPRSVSLGLHPVSELPADEIIDEILEQARHAESVGFAGVTLSEHHAGLAGYLPQPLMVSGWILEETTKIWSGPAPTLLTLRNAGMLAEELAWMSVRYPGRFCAAVASGYSPSDFEPLGLQAEDIPARFKRGLAALRHALSSYGPLSQDQAVEQWVKAPAPLLSAAHSPAAARRAAGLDLGVILIGSPDVRERPRSIVDAYAAEGGRGPVTWIRRCFIGQPPPEAMRELEAAYGAWDSGRRGTVNDFVSGSAEQVAETLREEIGVLGPGACLNVRVYLPGVSAQGTHEQIEQFGTEVLPLLRSQ